MDDKGRYCWVDQVDSTFFIQKVSFCIYATARQAC